MDRNEFATLVVQHTGEGFVIDDLREGLVVGYGPMNDMCADNFAHMEMVVRFTVNLSAGKETLKDLQLPEANESNGIRMGYSSAAASPLQVSLTVEMYKEGMTYDEACALLNEGHFELTDARGNMLDAIMLDSWGGTREREDGTWCIFCDYACANDASLPDVVSVSFIRDDGQVCIAPITIR